MTVRRCFRWATVFAVALTASSCAFAPVAVEGVQDARESPWLFVPVNAWLTRDDVRPQAVGMCDGEGCQVRVAVATFDVSGREIAPMRRVLADPRLLAVQVEGGNRARRALSIEANRSVDPAIAARRLPRRVSASAERFTHRNLSGFRLAIRRMEDGERAAYGAALARMERDRLRVVMVIGEQAGAVEATARAAADAHLR